MVTRVKKRTSTSKEGKKDTVYSKNDRGVGERSLGVDLAVLFRYEFRSFDLCHRVFRENSFVLGDGDVGFRQISYLFVLNSDEGGRKRKSGSAKNSSKSQKSNFIRSGFLLACQVPPS
jgi:hypothetical protein